MRNPSHVSVANVLQSMWFIKKDHEIRSSRKQAIVNFQEIRKNDFSYKCGVDGYYTGWENRGPFVYKNVTGRSMTPCMRYSFIVFNVPFISKKVGIPEQNAIFFYTLLPTGGDRNS